MADLSYVVQRPGEGPAILMACQSLASAGRYDRITGLYAFATLKGAQILSKALEDASPHWATAQKRWIISIDDGVTDPEALRFLLSLSRSELRVHDAEPLLARSLRPIRRFHPKTLLLERPLAPAQPTALLVGSANLTFNGLCLGHEHAMVAIARGTPIPASVTPGLVELERAIADATVVDNAFVDRYAAIRPTTPILPDGPDDARSNLVLQPNPVIEATRSAALAAADHFWIDIEYVVANLGPGQEGNQIDMQRGSRVYFGFGDGALPRNSPIGTVQISYGTHIGPRNIRFGNNQMDKLDLPLPGIEGPPSYSHNTLLFTRRGANTFDLQLGSPGDIAKWKSQSRQAGTLYRMQSGREFGVF